MAFLDSSSGKIVLFFFLEHPISLFQFFSQITKSIQRCFEELFLLDDVNEFFVFFFEIQCISTLLFFKQNETDGSKLMVYTVQQ